MLMKVFMCRRQDGYSGGLIVVAANSKEEAFKTFCEDPRYYWMVYRYPRDEWFECKTLTANVDKPCVIMEDGYTE